MQWLTVRPKMILIRITIRIWCDFENLANAKWMQVPIMFDVWVSEQLLKSAADPIILTWALSKNTHFHHFSRMLSDLLKKSNCKHINYSGSWWSGVEKLANAKWMFDGSLRGVAHTAPYCDGYGWPFSTCLIWPWISRSRSQGENGLNNLLNIARRALECIGHLLK